MPHFRMDSEGKWRYLHWLTVFYSNGGSWEVKVVPNIRCSAAVYWFHGMKIDSYTMHICLLAVLKEKKKIFPNCLPDSINGAPHAHMSWTNSREEEAEITKFHPPNKFKAAVKDYFGWTKNNHKITPKEASLHHTRISKVLHWFWTLNVRLGI